MRYYRFLKQTAGKLLSACAGCLPVIQGGAPRLSAMLLLLLALFGTCPTAGADRARNYGTAGANAFTQATAVDASGNVYIAGYFTGATLALGNVTLSRIGIFDIFAAKLDATGAVVWAKNYGGSGAYAQGSGIAVDASGNVYLGGYFGSANLTTPALTKIGTGDAFALKLDASGNTIWAKNYGGGGADAKVNGIAVDATGNVYLGGYFANANLATPVLAKIGTGDAFALKLDASGNTAWAKNYGGNGASAQGTGIAVDATGNIYLGGYFQNASLTTPALMIIGNSDAFALKLDASGATAWAKNYGGSGAWAFGNGIAVDASGNVYLGGQLQSANLTTPALTKIGVYDVFALKLDASGATAWAKNYGGSGAGAWGSGIAADASGNVYLAGYFQNANLTTPVLTMIGGSDAFALKLDTSGATAWAKNYGGSGAGARGSGIAVDASGNVYLGGYFYTANLTTPALTNIGGNDAFILMQSLATVPAAPTGVSAVAGNAQATVSFTAPASDGGSTITGYMASCAPHSNFAQYLGEVSKTGGASPITVTGLTNGTPYNCWVKAANSVGYGNPSAISSTITPTAPPPPPPPPPPQFPNLVVSPLQLTFSAQIGKSVTQALQISNAGDAPLSGLDHSPVPDISLDATACKSGVAPGASCTLVVKFTPTAVYAQAPRDLWLGSNGGTIKVSLILTGVTPLNAKWLESASGGSAAVSVAADDLGKPVRFFVGIEISGAFYFLSDKGWQLWLGQAIPAVPSSAISMNPANQDRTIPILAAELLQRIRPYIQAIYVGYGVDGTALADSDMLECGLYQVVYAAAP